MNIINEMREFCSEKCGGSLGIASRRNKLLSLESQEFLQVVEDE
jgi:predicted nucleic acid-binding Zn ribbon protein